MEKLRSLSRTSFSLLLTAYATDCESVPIDGLIIPKTMWCKRSARYQRIASRLHQAGRRCNGVAGCSLRNRRYVSLPFAPHSKYASIVATNTTLRILSASSYGILDPLISKVEPSRNPITYLEGGMPKRSTSPFK